MDTTPEDPIGESIAALAPKTLAAKAEQPLPRMFMLAVLAGAFIAFGSIASFVAQANMTDVGAVRLLSGAAFSVGLAMVMIVGAELFTGNTMMVLPAVQGRLPVRRLLTAWTIVWLGNLVGSIAIAVQFAASNGLGEGVGNAAMAAAESKLSKSPFVVFCSAILANILVCLAVWMSMGAHSLFAKSVAIVGPVMVFVAAGLEHSIANMSILPLAWLAPEAAGPEVLAAVSNLAFSTLGNLVGGSALAICIAYGHDALRSPD